MRFKSFLIWFLVLPFSLMKAAYVPEVDYVAEFGKNWVNAQNIISAYQDSFKILADSFSVPYDQVISVGFPELIRYSSVKDKMEVTLLKILYAYKGKDYADFSVGIFQMKPSFAEKIREEVFLSSDSKLKEMFGSDEFLPNERNQREQLISGLGIPSVQFRYLIAFYRLYDSKFSGNFWADNTEKIKFYATAYNCGFYHPRDYIDSMMKKKFYSTNVLKSGPYYLYSDIAAFYYQYLNRGK